MWAVVACLILNEVYVSVKDYFHTTCTFLIRLYLAHASKKVRQTTSLCDIKRINTKMIIFVALLTAIVLCTYFFPSLEEYQYHALYSPKDHFEDFYKSL